MTMSARVARPLAAIAGGLITVVAVAGCGTSSPNTITPRTLTFPVLWAGSNPDGTPAAGIEPATIAVGTEGDAGFTVNLEDIKAKQAGPSWQAATASAATVATLITGVDQSAVDLTYDITGAIDGPSGGGALTVGTMAAITGATVKPKIAMTGTIAPDGTIGTVAQVPAKVRAAKKAGYRTVLVPFGNRTEFDPSVGREVNLIAYGKSLGMDVRVVKDIAQAYYEFTGKTVVPQPRVAPTITPRARQVAVRTTRSAVAALRRELAAGDNLIPAADRPAIQATVTRASEALASGRTALAYGLAVRGTYQVKRALAAGASRALVADKGVAAARAALRDEVSTLLATANREIDAQSDPSGLTTEQRLALPAALGWYVYSRAILTSLVKSLGPKSTWGAAELEDAASVVGDVEASLLRFGPDAVAMVKASPGAVTADDAETVTFLSGYTNFLVRAGDANRDYYVTVDHGQVEPGGGPNDIAPVLAAMSEIIRTTPTDENSLDQEIVQAANAVTYYVLGATVVSGRSFGMQGFGQGEDPSAIGAPALLAASVKQASATVYWWSADLQPKGANLSYPLWQRQWADAVFAAYAGTPTGPAAGTIALNELWYAAAGVLLANSADVNLKAVSGG